ncbi:hypothetical protein C3F09_02100 [candidate division GN15 bacterium]|uniref:Doubled CXXCH motif domain-containing protein n=1 Tax=candidate division GN15 bacterium TaxID=2072418 RepID=A0A855X5K3_9BACT|nr:MAG: hypothetical protein C3F09_02100 [candidate division GN15 bacterium]
MGGSSFRDKLESLLATVVLVGFVLLVHLSRAKDQPSRPHEAAECSICHVAVADIDGADMAFIDASTRCRSCHLRLDELRNPKLTFHADTSRRCLDCHTFHSPDEVTVGDRTFHAEAQRTAQRALCSSCHGEGEDVRMLSEGHRAAAGLYHSDYRILVGLSPSEACLICHSEQSRSEMVASLTTAPVPTFSRHGNHPTGISMSLGRQLAHSRMKSSPDSDIRLFNGRIECQTCHSLSSSAQFHLISGTDSNTLCRKCHDTD